MGGVSSVLQDEAFWDELPTPKNKIKICVCDTGYDLGHEDLPLEPNDVIGSNNSDIDEEWFIDGHGHGTHVAGVIAALGNNNIGIRGIIPNNKEGNFQLIIAKAFNSSGKNPESTVLNAVESCVENGANIISLSLGGKKYFKISSEYYYDLYFNKGILIIAASGNDGVNGFMYPAGYSSVINVAAINEKHKYESFSNFNSQVEISAPGKKINSCSKNNKYKTKTGTSMAVPHVSAVAGLLWMYFPQCTNQQIRNVLSASAKTIGNDNCNTYTGYGLVQAIDAYKLLDKGNCGGYTNITYTKGGCEQLGPYSLSCSNDSDCDDGDPCTVNSCSAEGACATSINCTQCQKDALVTINIMTDFYPKETTWDIKKGSAIYASGGPYYAIMMLYTTYTCLAAGSYTFTIYDKDGDGLCSRSGDGNYNVTLDNTALKNGDCFEETESTRIDILTSNIPSTSPKKKKKNNKKKKSSKDKKEKSNKDKKEISKKHKKKI